MLCGWFHSRDVEAAAVAAAPRAVTPPDSMPPLFPEAGPVVAVSLVVVEVRGDAAREAGAVAPREGEEELEAKVVEEEGDGERAEA